MRIHTIKIRRIREIEELDIDCKDHSMIAIVGENGSGKTTVFFCLIFALTGELTLKGKKEEHVRDVGDGPAWVEVVFEVNGKVATVRRSMNTTTCHLKIEGVEKPIKGSKKVNGWLLEQGIVPDRLLQAFLPQGEADALFRATDAERATMCLRTFGLADTESYDEALRTAMDPIVKRIDETLDDRLEEAEAQHQIAKSKLEEASSRLEKASENRGILHDAEQVVRRSEAVKAADSKRAEIYALRERDAADKAQLTLERAQENETAGAAQQVIADGAEAYEAAKATIYAKEQFEKGAARRDQLDIESEEVITKLVELETPLRAAQEGVRTEEALQRDRETLQRTERQLGALQHAQRLQEQVAAARGRMEEATAAVQAAEAVRAALEPLEALEKDRQAFSDQAALWRHQLTHLKDGRCGTCGQVWADADDPQELTASIAQAEQALEVIAAQISKHQDAQNEIRLSSNRAQLAREAIQIDTAEAEKILSAVGLTFDEASPDLATELAAEQDRLKAIFDAHEWAVNTVAKLTHEVALLKQRQKSVRDQIESLNGQEVSAEDFQAAVAVTEAYEAKKQEMQATALRRDMLDKRIHDLDARLQKYEADLAALETAQTDSEDMDAEIITQAQKIIADSEAIHAEYDAAAAEQAGIKREFEMFERQVNDLTGRLKQQAIDRKKLDVLKGARFLLHREQLPRFVCSFYTEIVSQQWAEELERFGAKFTAWQDPENLEFYARFENGNERRVYQLSGGERQLAIVAYLRVRNRMFAPDLGVLGFDEPTTHVDEKYRPVIAEVFRNMAAQADDEGLQVFVVDHAPEFLSAIPAAIRLQKSA